MRRYDFAVAARVHHQIFDTRLRARAAQRAIEQNRAARRQAFSRFFFHRDGQRAGLDDDRIGACRLSEFRRGFQQRVGRRQRSHDDGAFPGHFVAISRDVAACLAVILPPPRENVVPHDFESRMNEIARHCRSHDSQSNHAYSLRLHGSPSNFSQWSSGEI